MVLLRIFPIFMLGFFFIASCKDEPQHPNYSVEKLTGRWELLRGWRNGKIAQTLTGTYYEFTEDEKLRTNLTFTSSAQEMEFPYDIDKNEIHQKSSPPAIYTIDSLTDSTLIFNMLINNVPFRLELTKVRPATEAQGVEVHLDTL